jgi:hypothetical protein
MLTGSTKHRTNFNNSINERITHMGNMSNMSNQTNVPTLSNWGEIESRNFYKGVEVVKTNRSSILPKEGATPLFRYKNKAGVIGDWYDINNVVRVDKTMQAENKRFANDLAKKVVSGQIDADKMKEVLEALGLTA